MVKQIISENKVLLCKNIEFNRKLPINSSEERDSASLSNSKGLNGVILESKPENKNEDENSIGKIGSQIEIDYLDEMKNETRRRKKKEKKFKRLASQIDPSIDQN